MRRRARAWAVALAVLFAGAPAAVAARGPARGRPPAAKSGGATRARPPGRAISTLRAPGADLEAARRLAAEGSHPAAERMCDQVLAADPTNLDALRERAYARSRQRKFAEARSDFNEVLIAAPQDLAALTGLAYTLAWSGDLESAEWTFQRALSIEPRTLDAAKGLAYVALWRGQAGEAARRFDVLARTRPDSAELRVALGQALYAEGRRDDARGAFEEALAVEPGRADALAGLEATALHPRVDATVLGGLTTAGSGGGGERVGVRFAELAVSPVERLRFWAQYDDTLSLDDPGLARRRARVPAVYAGGLVGWGGRTATRLELGYRRLPGRIAQGLVRGEQIIGLGGGSALRLGGWVGPREDERIETIANAGFSLALGPHLLVEPAVLWGRSGLAGENEVRGLLAAVVSSRRGGRPLLPRHRAGGVPRHRRARRAAAAARGVSGRAPAGERGRAPRREPPGSPGRPGLRGPLRRRLRAELPRHPPGLVPRALGRVPPPPGAAPPAVGSRGRPGPRVRPVRLHPPRGRARWALAPRAADGAVRVRLSLLTGAAPGCAPAPPPPFAPSSASGSSRVGDHAGRCSRSAGRVRRCAAGGGISLAAKTSCTTRAAGRRRTWARAPELGSARRADARRGPSNMGARARQALPARGRRRTASRGELAASRAAAPSGLLGEPVDAARANAPASVSQPTRPRSRCRLHSHPTRPRSRSRLRSHATRPRSRSRLRSHPTRPR